MFEKIKSLDLFTKILLVVCGIFMVSSITLGIIAVTRTGNSKNDETPVLTTQVETTETTTETTTTETTTTTTVTTTTTAEETTATETTTTAPKKTTTAPVEKHVSKPVETESPSKTEVYYPKEQSVPNEYDTYNPCISYKNSEFYAETICDSTEIYTWPTNYCVALAKLKPGTKVRIYDMSEYWCSVSVADGSGVSGFVRRSSLKMIGESDMEEYPDRSVEKCVVADETPLYPAPDITDDIITVIGFNERLTILREGWYWCYCEYKTETGSVLTGYVLSYDIY